MICPYCNNEAEFLSTKEFYGRDYGTNLYLCRPCNAYVGTRGNSETPLGTMANYELRELRKQAHSLFDPLWKGKGKKMSRTNAYRWMQNNLNLPPEKAHIAMFDLDQCNELISKVKAYRKLP